MGRRKTPDIRELKYPLRTRVNEKKYRELQALLAQNPNNDMSNLIRTLLNDRPVKIFTRDLTLDNTMEELARVRTEIRSIGININQITHKFNTYPEPQRKAFYAKLAFQEYLAIEPRIDRLLQLVSQLAKKWLSE